MAERKVMLVAGGSGSVGSAIAREALAQGWAVALHGRAADKLAALVAGLHDAGPVDAIVADVHQPDAAERIVAAASQAFGRIDAVIDCVATGPAGVQLTGRFADTDPAGYGPFYDLSAAWLQRLAHAAYPHLQARGGTLIAFISDAGRFAAPRQTVVGAARAAVIGFVRNLAIEAGHDGIRVNCLSPSYVLGSDVVERIGTSRIATAIKRAGLGLPTAADIAPMAVFLCGDGAAKITGQVISINGGLQA